MTSVLLVYPYFNRSRDRSRFRFPPLGAAYVAQALRDAGHDVDLLDCTFLDREQALARALAAHAEVVGVSCLSTLFDDAVWFADRLRGRCGLLVAGGPLPTCEPEVFLDHFDLVVRGEGERTMCELVDAYVTGGDPAAVSGVASRSTGRRSAAAGTAPAGGAPSPPRPFESDLDALPLPARDLLPNSRYIAHGRRAYGASVTTVMSTRGCPYDCEFCSNVVFGLTYREHSPARVVDEIEACLALGYERISFADDVFTLKPARVAAICDEIAARGLRFDWECLARVDTFDAAMARAMRRAGCRRVYFGIESGVDSILRLMNKGITVSQARDAVWEAHDADLQVGAFFILCYPGETDETVLETLRFAGSLPLDYLGLSMPYPLPGTSLYARVGERIDRTWRPQEHRFFDHARTFRGDFTAAKMQFAIAKGQVEFRLRRHRGSAGRALAKLFARLTDVLFRLLR